MPQLRLIYVDCTIFINCGIIPVIKEGSSIPWLAAMLLLCLFFDCLAMIVVCITKVMNGNRCGQVNVCFLHVLPALLYETCFSINSWYYVWSVIQGLSEKLVVFLPFVSNIMRILDSLNKKVFQPLGLVFITSLAYFMLKIFVGFKASL